jgi:hypothetical protein
MSIYLRNQYQVEYVWETIVFAVAILSTVTLSCLALFYNFIPGVKRDEYRKHTAEERHKETAALLKTKSGHKDKSYSETPGGSDFRQESPEKSANILSILTYSWLNPILNIGYRRVLEDQDLYALRNVDSADHNSKLFQKHWKAELKKSK